MEIHFTLMKETEALFSPTTLAIKFKFGNMQSISWNKLALWHDQKQHPNFWSLKNFHHHTILLTSQKPNLITHSNCNIDQTVENNSKAQLIAFEFEVMAGAYFNLFFRLATVYFLSFLFNESFYSYVVTVDQGISQSVSLSFDKFLKSSIQFMLQTDDEIRQWRYLSKLFYSLKYQNI